jgi:hypothetical protein
MSSWKLAGLFAFGVILASCSDAVDVDSLLASAGTTTTTTTTAVVTTTTTTTAAVVTTTTLPVETATSVPEADSPVEPLPTNAPVLPIIPPPVTIEVRFDEPAGASADERRRLENLRVSAPVASVLEVGRSSGGALSPDGTRLVVAEGDQLCVIVIADAEKTCASFGAEYAGTAAARSDLPLLWSPDSRRIAVAVPTSIWRDEVWVFDPMLLSFIPVENDQEWSGRLTLLAWYAPTNQILVLRSPSDRSESGDVALVGTDSGSATLYSFADGSLNFGVRFGSFSADRGLLLFGNGQGAARVTRAGVESLRASDGPAARAVAIAIDASTAAFVSRNDGGFQAVEGPSFVVDTDTGLTYELPGEPDHIMFDPTSTWVASVVEDTSTDPTTYVVSVAPISDPGAGVEVFRSNSDEFFARTDRDGRREPGTSPPAPPPIWSDQDTLLIPLSQQGSILVIDLTGW